MAAGKSHRLTQGYALSLQLWTAFGIFLGFAANASLIPFHPLPGGEHYSEPRLHFSPLLGRLPLLRRHSMEIPARLGLHSCYSSHAHLPRARVAQVNRTSAVLVQIMRD